MPRWLTANLQLQHWDRPVGQQLCPDPGTDIWPRITRNGSDKTKFTFLAWSHMLTQGHTGVKRGSALGWAPPAGGAALDPNSLLFNEAPQREAGGFCTRQLGPAP